MKKKARMNNMSVQNSLTKSKQRLGFTAYLTQEAVKEQINKVVGSKNGIRFTSSIISAVNANPALAECTNQSILSSALLGHSLNLSPSPQLGQFYMVPYQNKKAGTKEAQFQLGYKGYIQLAIRSGQYKKLNVLAIKEGELVKFDPLNEEIEVNLIEDEEERENTPTAGYYAFFEYVNGFHKAIYWSKSKMLAHADKYSSAFSLEAAKKLESGKIPQADMWKYSSYWYKDFDSMAFKTMLRQLISRWGVMSLDMASAMDADMAVIHEDGTKDYVETEDIVDMPQTQEEPQEEAKTEENSPADEAAAALFGGN